MQEAARRCALSADALAGALGVFRSARQQREAHPDDQNPAQTAA